MIKLPAVCVFTLGCKVNSYDSDAMIAVLTQAGFAVTDELTVADIYVVNTCAVTAEAERKSRQTVTRVLKLNPKAEIYVCGCASQNDFSQFAKNNVVFIGGTDGKVRLARELAAKYSGAYDGYFDKIVASDFNIDRKYEENDGALSLRTRHFIKVQDGCNNFCSYCLVPYVRGRSRSRAVESIKAELDEAAKTSKEVVVTGINLSAYGLDVGSSLTELMKELSDYEFRIRLGSLEANVITREFLDATKALKKFCPHFHLSLQSGDNGVLRAMNRRYGTEDYFKAVELIRSYYPGAAITTDVIVGYPTEDEEAFCNSMAFARAVGFADVHVFPYSSRNGTVAGKLKPLLPAVVAERAKRMAEVKHELTEAYLKAQLGRETEVLFETKENGLWCGHTPNYVRVYAADGARNTLKTVVPTALHADGVRV